MYEKAFLDKALLELQNNTDIKSELLSAVKAKQACDYVVKLNKNDVTQTFYAYTKLRPSISQLGLLLSHNKKGEPLLIADYVSPALSQFLKNNECNFIDSAGNAYLNFGSVFVYMTGNKAPEALAEIKPSRAFQSTGLKLIFTLLCHPDDITNRSYRDLSEVSGISLGSIGWIINDLKAAGYLSFEKNGERAWTNKDGLIKKWVSTYAEKLRPKLVLGYYKSLQEGWQKAVDIKSFGAIWGSEVAADHLTHYLKPEFSTIYTEEKLGKLVLMNGLKKTSEKSGATVEVLQKFWHFENRENPDLAPVLLIYADLIASGDSRNLETARVIYEEYINVSK